MGHVQKARPVQGIATGKGTHIETKDLTSIATSGMTVEFGVAVVSVPNTY